MTNTEAWAERSGSERAVLHRSTELLRELELSPGIRAHMNFLVKTVLAHVFSLQLINQLQVSVRGSETRRARCLLDYSGAVEK